MSAESAARKAGLDEHAQGLARALAGAVLFSLPMMMTMEMWWLGFYLDRVRLLIFLVVTLAILVPLSRLIGFENTTRWTDDIRDVLTAWAIAAFTSTVLLFLFGVLSFGMPADEVIGKIAIQTIPASFGAIIARDQMGGQDGPTNSAEKIDRAGYPAQLLVMLAGANFLAFNVAPTEEMILIAFKMGPGRAIGLILLSLLTLHAFVFALGFKGTEPVPKDVGFVVGAVRHSLAGYAVAITMSTFALWTFGRLDGASIGEAIEMVIVLGFPAAVGAAAARLVV